MSISLGILFGIVAMLSWGVSDFLAAKAARKTSVLSTLFWSQIAGILMLLLIYPLFFKVPAISLAIATLILASAFLNIVALLGFYKGMQIGSVSIISPIASAYSTVTVILSLIFLNEKLSGLQATGIILAISGAVLTSFRFHDLIKLNFRNSVAGVKYGLISLFSWGIFFVLVGILVKDIGWFLPPLIIKTIGIFYMLSYAGASKKTIPFPKNTALFIILLGILETIGFLSVGAGMGFEQISIVAPVSSTYPLITIILAQIFFKEIIDINQKVGVAAVLFGLVLLAI